MLVKVVKGGYITMIGRAITGTEINEREYGSILSALQSRPQPKDGFALMLKDETLEWDYVALPEPTDENAEISDYENSLADLGVRFGD